MSRNKCVTIIHAVTLGCLKEILGVKDVKGTKCPLSKIAITTLCLNWHYVRILRYIMKFYPI